MDRRLLHPKAKARREATGHDILSWSLPIVVRADELASAESEEWVTVCSMHVPPAEETPSVSVPPIRSDSPSVSSPTWILL